MSETVTHTQMLRITAALWVTASVCSSVPCPALPSSVTSAATEPQMTPGKCVLHRPRFLMWFLSSSSSVSEPSERDPSEFSNASPAFFIEYNVRPPNQSFSNSTAQGYSIFSMLSINSNHVRRRLPQYLFYTGVSKVWPDFTQY